MEKIQVNVLQIKRAKDNNETNYESIILKDGEICVDCRDGSIPNHKNILIGDGVTNLAQLLQKNDFENSKNITIDSISRTAPEQISDNSSSGDSVLCSPSNHKHKITSNTINKVISNSENYSDGGSKTARRIMFGTSMPDPVGEGMKDGDIFLLLEV